MRRKFEEGAGRWRSPKESKTKANELAKKTGFKPEDRNLSHEISRWKTKAGETVHVRNESKIDNLKRSAAERKACGQARARGEHTREGGRDLTAPAGARQTPKEIKPPTAKPSAPSTPAEPPGAKPSTELPPGAKPPTELPPGAKPLVEPSPAGPSAVEGLAGKLGGIAGVIGGIAAVRTLADDFKMHTNPSDPTLGPAGTIRTDSLGNQWIKTDEKTWVSKAYHDKMA